ncbi:response regulator transcription factor [Sediminibacterium sp.]|uniref:response regulator transcription factor n=1 Tax=Sediminibacterium sp. TaxID=1917865 RepID=UPI003F6FBDA1
MLISKDQVINRELFILQLLAKGLTNREIANVLGISVETVKVHNKHIYRKLNERNRSEGISLVLVAL